jgi:hypothetical protein
MISHGCGMNSGSPRFVAKRFRKLDAQEDPRRPRDPHPQRAADPTTPREDLLAHESPKGADIDAGPTFAHRARGEPLGARSRP